jgi:hypothetical protein
MNIYIFCTLCLISSFTRQLVFSFLFTHKNFLKTFFS